MAVTSVTTAMAGAINYTVVTDTSADWPSVANSTYFYDKADKLVHYKDSTGTVQEIFSGSGLTVGTTAVTSGTDTRVFFQQGGVIQQDANFTFDNTLKRLTLKAVGTAATDIPFVVRNSTDTFDILSCFGNETTIIGRNASNEPRLIINRAGTTKMTLGGTADLNIQFPNSGYGQLNSGTQGWDIISTSGDIRTRNSSTSTILKGNFFGVGIANPAARLDVQAQGALSTDIAFRVRNSADTADIFSVRGNGDMYIPAAPFNNQNVIYFAGTTDSIIRYSPTAIGSVAFGQGASITNATYYNTAIGNQATTGASSGFGIAIGFQTSVNSTGGIVIGDRAKTIGADTIVIGNTGGATTYSGSRSIYLGKKGNSGNSFSSDDVFMTHFNSDLSSTLIRANGSLGLLGQQAYIFQNGTGTYGVETFMGNGGNTLVIANHPNVPSTNIANAGQIYVEGGALKYRGSSGTVTVIAPA